MDLNKHAKKAQEIALNREYFHDVPSDTGAVLKHLAGEVVETSEALALYAMSNYKQEYKADLAGELADVITCCLIIAANENIDIENALQQCQQKNEARAVSRG